MYKTSDDWSRNYQVSGIYRCNKSCALFHLLFNGSRVNQTKFAKVFTSVCLSTGGCLPQCMLGYTPGSRQPPCAVHAGRYGQQAGGTHPTGMHTCIFLKPSYFLFDLFLEIDERFLLFLEKKSCCGSTNKTISVYHVHQTWLNF